MNSQDHPQIARTFAEHGFVRALEANQERFANVEIDKIETGVLLPDGEMVGYYIDDMSLEGPSNVPVRRALAIQIGDTSYVDMCGPYDTVSFVRERLLSNTPIDSKPFWKRPFGVDPFIKNVRNALDVIQDNQPTRSLDAISR